MDILQIVALGIISTSLIIILKSLRPEFTIYISILTGILIFYLLIPKFVQVINLLQDLSNRADLNIEYFSTLLKIIGVAYIVEFGSQLCRDAGENSIALKIEMAGKLSILVLALPIVLGLVDLILKVLP